MANRAKHARNRIIARVVAGRMTKTDQTPAGQARYDAVREALPQEELAMYFEKKRLLTAQRPPQPPPRVRQHRVLPLSTFLSGRRN